MMQRIREPLLYQSSSLLKILSLLLIILLSLLFTLIFGMALGLLFFGTDVVSYLNDGLILSDPSVLPLLKYLQVINTIGMFVFPPLIFALLVSKRPFNYLLMDRSAGMLSAVTGVAVVIVCLPFLHWLAGINEMMSLPEWLSGIETWMKSSEDQARELTELFLSGTTFSALLLNLLMIAVLPAIGEELLFRGVLQRLFREWTGNIHLAVFIAAFLFSALHLQFYGFLPRFVLGLFLGYLFVWTGSIWVPVIVHFFNNGVAVTAAWLYANGRISSNAESLGEMPQPFVIIGSFILSLVLLALIRYRQGTKKGSTMV